MIYGNVTLAYPYVIMKERLEATASSRRQGLGYHEETRVVSNNKRYTGYFLVMTRFFLTQRVHVGIWDILRP